MEDTVKTRRNPLAWFSKHKKLTALLLVVLIAAVLVLRAVLGGKKAAGSTYQFVRTSTLQKTSLTDSVSVNGTVKSGYEASVTVADSAKLYKVSEVKVADGKRPLFILLDGTWSEARKMFRKSPYLEHLPVLSLEPEQLSRYKLRRSKRDDHFCTAEVAALCLELAEDQQASEVLDAYLDVFSTHYLAAKFQLALDPTDSVHTRLAPYL